MDLLTKNVVPESEAGPAVGVTPESGSWPDSDGSTLSSVVGCSSWDGDGELSSAATSVSSARLGAGPEAEMVGASAFGPVSDAAPGSTSASDDSGGSSFDWSSQDVVGGVARGSGACGLTLAS